MFHSYDVSQVRQVRDKNDQLSSPAAASVK